MSALLDKYVLVMQTNFKSLISMTCHDGLDSYCVYQQVIYKK